MTKNARRGAESAVAVLEGNVEMAGSVLSGFRVVEWGLNSGEIWTLRWKIEVSDSQWCPSRGLGRLEEIWGVGLVWEVLSSEVPSIATTSSMHPLS